MFEGFSFPSPSSSDSLRLLGSGDDERFLRCESNLVSPLSSRCPSPRLRSRDHSSRINKGSRSPFHLGPAPTSIPPSYVDQHRLSIGTLTRKLNAQTLEPSDPGSDSDEGRGFPITPRSAYLEPNGSTQWMDRKPSIAFISPQYGDKHNGFPQSYLDVSPTSTPQSFSDRRYSHPANCTSAPNTSTSRHGSIEPNQHRQSLSALRSQREELSILQCATMSIADTIRLAQLLDEDERFRYGDDYVNDGQHPSSLPPSLTPPRRHPQKKTESMKGSRSSKLSATAASRCKVDKTYVCSDRRNARPGPNGLRRRSLVLAAVSAVLEAEASTRNRDCMTDSKRSDQLHTLQTGSHRLSPQPTL
ncbi:hypothetical protein PRK78_006168 [Emydomyces testavorans]|uniref:Uncharacterized protein n=1 Tax=Emydomyces testavorans TaxID=2070801 RepID=A0AAF0DNN5_9EURO|nr:hypothetical protein PRK78_006168 [Emydomyces testavorans]